jgi:ribonuclease R
MNKKMPAREQIVRRLEQAGRPLSVRDIAAAFQLPAGPEITELLDDLVSRGQARRLGGHRYAAVKGRSAVESWVGKLSMNPRGFGFVAALGKDDVYVAPDAIGAAFHGDKVEIEIVGRSNRGVEGRVVNIVARRSPRIAGLLRRRGKSAWLEPDDSRIRGPIVLSSASKIGRDGEAAVASITRFPEFPDENAEAELISVLGAPGDPNVEVAKILLREGVEEQHPEAAVREAEALSARTLRSVSETRRDLRAVPLPTIDRTRVTARTSRSRT